MAGISGMLRCAAVAEAHGVELVPHQTQPTIGHTANLHLAASLPHMKKPCEWNDPSPRQHAVFKNPQTGRLPVPSTDRAGSWSINEAGLAKRRVPIA